MISSLLLTGYSFILLIALIVSAPWWLFRMATAGRYREGLWQRLGFVPSTLCNTVHGESIVWLHAVSVGEVLAATRLIADLKHALPGSKIVVSTTTRTGQILAQQRFGASHVFYFPLDFAWIVRRYLRTLQPKILILMESELWPRVLFECERANIPVAVVNARVSDRSLPRYQALRVLWRPLLQKITLLLTQSEEDARRWTSLGIQPSRVSVSGNLKYDVRVGGSSPLVELLSTHLPQPATTLVCGSTLDGEEILLLQCWKPLAADAVMILAPRHPERFEPVAAIISAQGFQCVRLSTWRHAPSPIAFGEILLVDSIGELAALYSLATVAFIGGSLVNAGGHNPLEPAQFGVPVITGSHYANFRAMVDAMQAANAITVVSSQDLCQTLSQLLQHPAIRKDLGTRAQIFHASQAGATQRTIDALLPLLQRGQA